MSPIAVVVAPNSREIDRPVSLLEILGFRVRGNTHIVECLITVLGDHDVRQEASFNEEIE